MQNRRALVEEMQLPAAVAKVPACNLFARKRPRQGPAPIDRVHAAEAGEAIGEAIQPLKAVGIGQRRAVGLLVDRARGERYGNELLIRTVP